MHELAPWQAGENLLQLISTEPGNSISSVSMTRKVFSAVHGRIKKLPAPFLTKIGPKRAGKEGRKQIHYDATGGGTAERTSVRTGFNVPHEPSPPSSGLLLITQINKEKTNKHQSLVQIMTWPYL
jgi:hypothetical protein